MKALLLAVTLLLTAQTAQAGSITYWNSLEASKGPKNPAVWVTIYNMVGRISDYGCVLPGHKWAFGGYFEDYKFQVRTQVMDGPDCSGQAVHDSSLRAPATAPAERVGCNPSPPKTKTKGIPQ